MAKEVSTIPIDVVCAMARFRGTVSHMHHHTDFPKALVDTVVPRMEYLHEMEVDEEHLEGFELALLDLLIRHGMLDVTNDADYLEINPRLQRILEFPSHEKWPENGDSETASSTCTFG